MTESSLLNSYEEVYEQIGSLPQQLDANETAFLASLVPSDTKLDVLDIGCAEGELAVRLALEGHTVTAADIAEGFLNRARQLAEGKGLEIRAVKCNIEDDTSQLGDRAFDVILFTNVVEHLTKLVVAIENIRRLLRDDGVLWLQTPNVYRVSRVVRHLIHRRPFANFHKPANLCDLHFQTYDYLTLAKTLAFVGFEVCEIVPTQVTLPVLGRLRCLDPAFRALARVFPFLSDNLLLRCQKAAPIDVHEQIRYWQRTRGGEGLS